MKDAHRNINDILTIFVQMLQVVTDSALNKKLASLCTIIVN